MELEKLLTTAIHASLIAGEEIMKVYASDFDVEKKEDKSPLTLADKNAHNAIAELLAPTLIPVLSEEGRAIPYSERKSWNRLWIVDPLDGTKEFVKRNGEFTVNIALVENNLPVLGVIYQPVTKALYFALKGLGAYKMDGSRGPSTPLGMTKLMDIHSLIAKAEKLPLDKKPGVFTIVGSRSHMSSETYAYAEEMKKLHGEVEFISSGSSIKMCLVAEGTANCYPRFGPTMEWDTAAGQAIAQCAGKEFIDLSTNETMRYNREILLNNFFVVK